MGSKQNKMGWKGLCLTMVKLGLHVEVAVVNHVLLVPRLGFPTWPPTLVMRRPVERIGLVLLRSGRETSPNSSHGSHDKTETVNLVGREPPQRNCYSSRSAAHFFAFTYSLRDATVPKNRNINLNKRGGTPRNFHTLWLGGGGEKRLATALTFQKARYVVVGV